MKITLINNTERHRFETEIQGEYAYVEYRFYHGEIVLMHTFVPEFARGLGIAFALAKFAFEYIKAEDLKVVLYCPVMAKFIRLHPEYSSFIDKRNSKAI